MHLENYSKLGAEQLRQATPGMRSFANSLKRLDGPAGRPAEPAKFRAKRSRRKGPASESSHKSRSSKSNTHRRGRTSRRLYAELPAMAKRLAFSNLAPSRLATIALADRHLSHRNCKAERNSVIPNIATRGSTRFRTSLLSPAPIYPEMEEAALTAWLEEARKVLGAERSVHQSGARRCGTGGGCQACGSRDEAGRSRGTQSSARRAGIGDREIDRPDDHARPPRRTDRSRTSRLERKEHHQRRNRKRHKDRPGAFCRLRQEHAARRELRSCASATASSRVMRKTRRSCRSRRRSSDFTTVP